MRLHLHCNWLREGNLMSQVSNLSIGNATFPAVRADINGTFGALFSANSGNSPPPATVAFQDWIDTTDVNNKIWYKRNAANNAWLTIATIGTSAVTFPGSAKPLFGTVQTLSSSKVLTSGDDRDLLVTSTVGITITLPAVAAGYVFGMVNKSTSYIRVNAATPGTLIGSFPDSMVMAPSEELILTCDGVGWNILNGQGQIPFQITQFTATATYVPTTGCIGFLACVYGATGGTRETASFAKGGTGGAGYSEKFYAAPLAGSYSIVIGAGGIGSGSTGNTGGTTTFGGVISVPSSAGAAGNGTAGAAGTGGDFNATGGTGGNGGTNGGGGGGSASRAGNGGNGAAGTGSIGGGGGGTGGNSASGSTRGAAATVNSVSAYNFGSFFTSPVFSAGSTGTTTGGDGANGNTVYSLGGTIGSFSSGEGTGGSSSASSSGRGGQSGHVTIVEFF